MANILARLISGIIPRRWSAGKIGAPWPKQTEAERQTDNPINADIAERLDVLRAKTINEAANNAVVDGVISTHAEDWIGHNGPTLRVHSGSVEYNDALEKAWQTWFRAPCLDPRMSGAALLKLWVRDLWTCGEFLAQRVNYKIPGGSRVLKLKPIHPRRLLSPMTAVSDPHVVMGIKVDGDCVPVMYYIARQGTPLGQSLSTKFDEIDARYMIHEFPVVEADQVRGIPFLAPSLDAITDMREYDDYVLEAASAAAKLTVVWKTTHEDAKYVKVDKASGGTVARGQHTMGVPCWEPMQIQAQQPGAKYIEHRRERQAEIGRPAGMPLISIRQDAANHNYSSARFDTLGYWRRVLGYQHWLGGCPASRGILYDLVDDIALEGAVGLPPRPDDVTYEFGWPKAPQIDPEKEAKAERIGLENGTLTYTDALDARGKSLDTAVEQRKHETQLLENAGLPPLPTPPAGQPPEDDDGDDSADDKAGNKSEDSEDEDE